MSENSEKVYYLILNLALHFDSSSTNSNSKPFTQAKLTSKQLGINLQAACLRRRRSKDGNYKYLFNFKDHLRDDNKALKFTESFLTAVYVLCQGGAELRDEPLVLRIEKKLIKRNNTIFIDNFNYDNIFLPDDRFLPTLYSNPLKLQEYFRTVDSCIEEAWKFTPVLFQNENLLRGINYLLNSEQHYYFGPEMFHEPPDLNLSPIGIIAQVQMENCLYNAFKALETVIGDPPKNDTKLITKLKQLDLNPKDNVGLVRKISLLDLIREMNQARDKKTAHGAPKERQITFYQMAEYQFFTRELIFKAIKKYM